LAFRNRFNNLKSIVLGSFNPYSITGGINGTSKTRLSNFKLLRMKFKTYIFLLLTIALLFSTSANSQGFLHTDGQNIVNENGDNVLLRGMGLGGWMLQEGYMLQTSGFANAQWQLKEKVTELVGEEKMNAFYDAWLANHVTKADIDALKSWGFNSIRLPMHFNLFTLPIQEEPVEGVNTWLTKGFELTDSLISWCVQNEMYVILDLHAAPGGQGYDQAISDYNPDLPSIWESVPNRNKAASLWKKLAERYVDETWVAGYDLLNEPNWNTSGLVLKTVYSQMTDSIRSVDTNHMIIIEGNWFANDFSGLTPPWDDNLVYSPHKYWSINDQASIQWVLDMREEHNVPLYLGESGENSNVWFRDAIKLLEDNNIGWAWWPMKKVESIAGPMSILKTDDYQSLLNYWNDGGVTPTVAFAEAALMELAENTKFENCVFQKDVIDAMFRQVYSNETIPYNVQNIPGVVQPTDFSMGVHGEAYFETTSLANYSVSTGNYTSWNDGWAYRNDAVDIEVSEDNNAISNGYNIGFMGTGEWLQFDVNVATAGLYDVEIRLAAGGASGKLHLEANAADLTGVVDIANTGGWQSWETITVPNVVLDPSDTKIRFYVDQDGYNLGALNFISAGASNTIVTDYVSATTTNETTVNLFINKPLEGPLPGNPADFILYVNGTSIPITNTVLDPSNNRIVTFTVAGEFQPTDLIQVSYTGTTINAQDGTALELFNLQPVQNTIVQLTQIPGLLEAEDFSFQAGIQLEDAADTGGGQNIGFLDPGDYLDYQIEVTQPGLFNVGIRNASLDGNGQIEFQRIDAAGNATSLRTVSFTPTGGWQTWETTETTVPLVLSGEQQLRVLVIEGPVNINWFEFAFLTGTEEPTAEIDAMLFPNPTKGQFHLTANLQKEQDVTITLYNLLGNVVLSKKVSATKQLTELLDISAFAKGNYFVKMQLENGTTTTLNLVKS
jgi:endoglucanase